MAKAGSRQIGELSDSMLLAMAVSSRSRLPDGLARIAAARRGQRAVPCTRQPHRGQARGQARSTRLLSPCARKVQLLHLFDSSLGSWKVVVWTRS